MKTIIDTEVTKVKFLIDKPVDQFTGKNEVIEENGVFAYFPEDIHHTDSKDVFYTCYAHIGQHSACHPDYAKECKEATKEQYQDLKAELESIGYNLLILNRK